MRRRRIECDKRFNKISVQGLLEVTKEGNSVVFEIGNEITSDVAEAVCILMRKIKWNDKIWNMEINENSIDTVVPENSLFWLTGGDSEWNTLGHYNKTWSECHFEFKEEFELMVIKIVKESKFLVDIRDGFMKYLNLPVLYDFAIKRGMIK